MIEKNELMKFFEMSQEFRKYNHSALWEEEKHFTWWISIIFTALILVFLSNELSDLQESVIITIGSIFGIFLSLFGYIVIRKEGIYFTDALETFCRTAKALELHKLGKQKSESTIRTPLMPEYPINESFEEARNKANKSLPRLLKEIFKPKMLGIRDCFQLIFVISGFIFFVFCILSWLSFMNNL